jgi:hypothetical protein
MHTKFWLKNLKRKDHLELLGTDRKITSEWTLRRYVWEGVDWIHVTWDRDQWQVLVNMVMNFQLLYKVGNFLKLCDYNFLKKDYAPWSSSYKPYKNTQIRSMEYMHTSKNGDFIANMVLI